ncbi:MAG: FAD-binding oxidoreductase [Bacteriovoracaceae bacterium]|jgi:alkyldihydroxyacetonephosphate synthase|nr:FAD-binding oxidoreductase [Bacteriovoracaceae bacterium]
MNHRFQMKWWGWGEDKIKFELDSKPGILPYVKKKFDIGQLKKAVAPDLDQIPITPSQLPQGIVDSFTKILGEKNISCEKEDIILHSLGKSYFDLIRLRLKTPLLTPDLVLYPDTEEQISSIYQICEKEKIAIVPFGGGTSVSSGVEALKGSNDFVISLDLRNFKQITKIDRVSNQAHVEGGIFGPELEEELMKEGYTLGHFPQSFEFSTLGGWIATRSSGQNSIIYGGIEKMVTSLRMISPSGVIETLNTPRMAAGPDFKEMLTGSEGRFGIIISAVIKITPAPQEKKYRMYFFRSFKEAQETSRKIVQLGYRPAMIRVSDEEETEGMMAMGKSDPNFITQTISNLVKKHMVSKGYNLESVASVMIGYEGSPSENRELHKKVNHIFKQNCAIGMGTGPGKKWLKDRFFLPYLRDEFMENDLLVDTLETATTWENHLVLYDEVKKAIGNALSKYDKRYAIYTHISHMYHDGASLYFSIIAPQHTEDPILQWKEMKAAANAAIKKCGGSCSHHHGVGVDHIPAHHFSDEEKEVMGKLYNHFDPGGILNPGKLI